MAEKYVDMFVMPVPTAKLGVYEEFGEKMAAIAERHGAIEYVNSIADDVKPGKQTSFPQAVDLKEDEIVVQSWAVYPSKDQRDRANKAIMEDEQFKALSKDIPTDGKRMFTGGFRIVRGR